MKQIPLTAASSLTAALLFAATAAFAQGDLVPSGPPAPTFRTLTQVEPRIPIDADHTPGDANSVFRISTPGSYYLVGNISTGGRIVIAGTKESAIEVSASNVTIDLNGFRLSGGGSTNSIHGISVASGLKDLTVRNGTISDFNQDGIHAVGVSNGSYENLALDGNGANGLTSGDQSHVRNCRATGNDLMGIVVGDFSNVSDCQVRNNPKAGISATSQCVISRCTVGNASTGDGIIADSFCTVDRCTVSGAYGFGIKTTQRPIITDCVVSGCGHPDQNGVSGGILLHYAGLVKNCSISFNFAGMEILGSSDGGGASVLDNSIESNTAAGIDILSGGNRIDGNFFGFNGGPSLRTHTPGNVITRNHSVGAGSVFVLGGNDTVGPVAVGAGSLGTIAGGSNPWANIRQ